MKPDGHLLLVEIVLPADGTPDLGKILDMVMLVLPGGRKRTERKYRSLPVKAGFRITRIVPTNSAVSIVEAIPVWARLDLVAIACLGGTRETQNARGFNNLGLRRRLEWG